MKNAFETPPSKETYELGSPVERAHLMSFVIKSFALSRGDQGVQEAFMAWQTTRQSLTSFTELLTNAITTGTTFFSFAEWEAFFKAYRSIPRHTSVGLSLEELQNDIFNVFTNFLKDIQLAPPPNSPPLKYDGLNPVPGYMQNAMKADLDTILTYIRSI